MYASPAGMQIKGDVQLPSSSPFLPAPLIHLGASRQSTFPQGEKGVRASSSPRCVSALAISKNASRAETRSRREACFGGSDASAGSVVQARQPVAPQLNFPSPNHADRRLAFQRCKDRLMASRSAEISRKTRETEIA